jgi:hypothetical protein
MSWVGTTEAAALLRYFGCKTQLVEFLGEQTLLLMPFFGVLEHDLVCFRWASQKLLR